MQLGGERAVGVWKVHSWDQNPILPSMAALSLQITTFTPGIHPMRGISCRMASRWEMWEQAGTLGAWREGGSISPEGSRLLGSAALGCVLKHCCGCNDSGWRTFRSQMSLCEQKAALDRGLSRALGEFHFLPCSCPERSSPKKNCTH